MKREAQKTLSRDRRIARVRAKISGSAARPRLAVRRSLQHIYAQVIDDVARVTIAAASDADVTGADKMTKTEVAAKVGALVAERAIAKKVAAVVFDRRDKQYTGRVRALAEAAREAGLKF